MRSSQECIGDWFSIEELHKIERNEMRLPSNWLKAFSKEEIKQFYSEIEKIFIDNHKKITISKRCRELVSDCLDTYYKSNFSRLY